MKIFHHLLAVAILLLCAEVANATTYYLKNNNPTTDWNDACNWYTDPNNISGSDCNGVPGIFDAVIINGHSFINIQAPTTIYSLTFSGFGTIGGNFTFTIQQNATLYGNCNIGVAKTHILGNLNFHGGGIHGTDSAFVHGLTRFYANANISKPLVMLGGGEWIDYHINLSTSDGFLINMGLFEIHNLNRGVACNYQNGGEFKNFGTVIKDSPYNLTFNSPASMTDGEMELRNATTTFMNNFNVTNSELNVWNGATLDFNNGNRVFTSSILISDGFVKMKGGNLFNANCTASFDTLQIYGSGGGTFYIAPVVDHLLMVGGGAYFYEDFTIFQSFWWMHGHLYGGSVINCLPLAHLVEDGGSASYTSCKIIFTGGAVWTSGNYILTGGAQLNFPYGADFLVNLNSTGTISVNSSTPYGTINLSPESVLTKTGTGLAGLSCILNSNNSDILLYEGGLNIWRGTHNYSYFWINSNRALQCTNAGNYFYHSQITGMGTLRQTDFHSTIDSATTLDCHLEITGPSTLTVNCAITPLTLKILGTGKLKGTGNVTVSGTFTFGGTTTQVLGSGIITAQDTTYFIGSGLKNFQGKEIKMNGGGLYTATGAIQFGYGAKMRIPVGATLFYAAPLTLAHSNVGSPIGQIIVEGTLQKTTPFTLQLNNGLQLPNNGLITGIGTISTNNNSFIYQNTGTVAPGLGIGQLNWNGHFANATSGNLHFEFLKNGDGQVVHDAMHFQHNLQLGGTLTVAAADPCWESDTFTIITWAGTRTGSFATLNLPDDYELIIDDAAKAIRIGHTFLATAMNCPANIMTTTTPATCTAAPDLGLPSVNNTACSSNFIFQNDAPATFSVGTTIVTWTGTTPNGTITICQQNVQVSDNELPQITCPADISIEDCGNISIEIATAVASDNCGIASLSHDAPAQFFSGTTLVTHTATDIHGNIATCQQSVEIGTLDTQAPQFTSCPANRTKLTDLGFCGAVILFAAAATDNCTENPILTFSHNSGTLFPIGQTLVSILATDNAGNETLCEFLITINPRNENTSNGFDDDCDGWIDEPLKLAFIRTNATCYGYSNAGIDLSVSQGLPPYTFQWSDGSTDEDLQNVPAGTYSVTVMDDQGLTLVKSFELNQPAALRVQFDKNNPLCFGTASGSLTALPSRGVAPYSFIWSDGTQSQSRFGLPAGTYSLVVTDTHGCTISDAATLTEPNPLQISSMTILHNACFGAATGKISPVIPPSTKGTGALNYLWSNGQTTKTAQNLSNGSYSVLITDANGCTTTAAASVSSPTPILFSHSISGPNADGNFTVTLTASGGTPYPMPTPYRYCRLNPATQGCAFAKNNTFAKLPAGSTQVFRVRDANNCQQEISMTLPGLKPIATPRDRQQATINLMRSSNEALPVRLVINPFSEHCRLLRDGDFMENISVKVVDASGKLFMQKDWTASQPSLYIATGTLRPGIYFFQIATHDGQHLWTLRGVKV